MGELGPGLAGMWAACGDGPIVSGRDLRGGDRLQPALESPYGVHLPASCLDARGDRTLTTPHAGPFNLRGILNNMVDHCPHDCFPIWD